MTLFVLHPTVWGLAPEVTTIKAEAERRRFASPVARVCVRAPDLATARMIYGRSVVCGAGVWVRQGPNGCVPVLQAEGGQ
jgi:hypothetical protein